MKYLKTYENYKDPYDWKVGDIVVSINGSGVIDINRDVSYWSERGSLVKNEPYEIVEIRDTSDFGQTPERFTIEVKDRNEIIVQDEYSKFKSNFMKQNFITFDEWKFKNDTNKYNL